MPFLVLPDRALIGVAGQDAEHLLHNVLTCDVEGLAPGIAQPGALLTPQGKVLFDFLVARDGEAFLIDIAAGDADGFLKRMMLYKLRSKADFSKLEQMAVTVSWDDGPDTPETGPGKVLADRRFAGVTVRRVIGPRDAAAAAPAPPDAWRRLRIDHGVPESGADFALGDAFGHDISFDQNGGLDFKKGCFVGQEVVSRMQHRGTARRRVVIIAGATALPPAGAQITAGGKPAGALGTVVGERALAIVRLDRIKSAVDAGKPVLAGETPVSAALPRHVSYAWPGEETADDQAHA